MPDAVKSGDSIFDTPIATAVFQNSLIGMEAAYREGRIYQPTGNELFGNEPVKVRNDTGADLAMGHVVIIGDYLLGTIDPKRRWFEGLAVSTTFRPTFAIAARPIPSGAIGPVHTVGICPAIYNGSTPTKGAGYGPKPGAADLYAGYPGCRIEGIVDSTNKIALVSLE